MPKTITGSVGLGGLNQPPDVMVVQYLLNCVSTLQGGPMMELAVDGIIGSQTLQAIQRFQACNGDTTNGRVDPRGPTLAKLQWFDPYPQESFNPVGMKTGGKDSGEEDRTKGSAKSDSGGTNNPNGKRADPVGYGSQTSGGGSVGKGQAAGKSGYYGGGGKGSGTGKSGYMGSGGKDSGATKSGYAGSGGKDSGTGKSGSSGGWSGKSSGGGKNGGGQRPNCRAYKPRPGTYVGKTSSDNSAGGKGSGDGSDGSAGKGG